METVLGIMLALCLQEYKPRAVRLYPLMSFDTKLLPSSFEASSKLNILIKTKYTSLPGMFGLWEETGALRINPQACRQQ